MCFVQSCKEEEKFSILYHSSISLFNIIAFNVGAVEVEIVRRAGLALACQVTSRYLLISIDLLCLTLAGDLFAILVQTNVPGSIDITI